MSGIVKLSEHFKNLKAGFTVRDFLSDLQNYYLQAVENGVYIMPYIDCLENVEDITLNLGCSFGDFGKKVKSVLILPDEDVDFDELLPNPETLQCAAQASIVRDADGVERLLIEIKDN